MVAVSTLDEFFRSVPARCTPPLPDGVAVTFEVQGDGGGVWTLTNEDGTATVSRASADRPDCRLRCSAEALASILDGELDPYDGVLDGRLHLEGDVGLVCRLQGTARSR